MEPLYQLRCRVESLSQPKQEWVISSTGTLNSTVAPIPVWGAPEWCVVRFTTSAGGVFAWRVLERESLTWQWRDSIPGDSEILGSTSAQTDWVGLDEIMACVNIYGIDRSILDALIEGI